MTATAYGIRTGTGRWPTPAPLVWAMLCAVAGLAFAQGGQPARLIKLEGIINDAYAQAVVRKIKDARDEGAKLIILELNTPGGAVQASQELGDFIFTQKDVRVIAYINTKAYSGGTMVALACNEIYIDSAVGMMGDVAPITPTGEEVGEKFQSPIRKTLQNYAEARGYPKALVAAMVTKGTEVYRIHLSDDPTPRYVTGTELELMPEAERAKIVGGKELVNAPGQLLTLSAKDAEEYGFAHRVTSRQALYDALGLKASDVKRVYLTGSEMVLTYLDTFSPLLLAAGLVLLFIELTSSTHGLAGIAGLACIAAFIVVKVSLQYAHLFEILLFAAGLALLLIEVFLIPGFGVVGALGIALLFASVVLMFQQFTIPHTPGETQAFQYNVLKVLASFLAAGVGMLVFARYIGSVPMLNRLILRDTLASARVGSQPGERVSGSSELVGSPGIALTPLHPAGKAQFGERQLDVVTEGDFVEKGTPVEIVAVRGRQIVVKGRQGD